jgi:transketolase
MGAIVNGLTLSGFRAYGATFLTFSDYMKGSIRMAAIMECPSIFIFTHDSIGLGEDGPTHQPIEQLTHLRATPKLNVLRPADFNETQLAWRFALRTTNRPSAFSLSRQGAPTLDPDAIPDDAIERGAYVLRDADGDPDVILIGTGTEVSLALEAADALEDLNVRVVSMPCMDTFGDQDASYRDSVLPPAVRARVAVEAASPFSWYRWVGDCGLVIGMNDFGASAPAPEVYEHFGITAEAVAQAARDSVEKARA